MFCTIYKEKFNYFSASLTLKVKVKVTGFSNSFEILVKAISIPNLMHITEELGKLSLSEKITQTRTTPDETDGH